MYHLAQSLAGLLLLPRDVFSDSLLETCWVFISTNGRSMDVIIRNEENALRGWGEGSVGEALATRAWRPEFRLQTSHKTAKHGRVHLTPEWRQADPASSLVSRPGHIRERWVH